MGTLIVLLILLWIVWRALRPPSEPPIVIHLHQPQIVIRLIAPHQPDMKTRP